MTTILQPPVLAHDIMMAERFGSKVHPTGRIERRVVWNLLHHLNAAGFQLVEIDNGDESTDLCKGDDAERNLAAMNLIFDLDECHLYFRKPEQAQHYVYLALGNDGWDVVCDWSYSRDDADGFNAAMDAFDGEAFV